MKQDARLAYINFVGCGVLICCVLWQWFAAERREQALSEVQTKLAEQINQFHQTEAERDQLRTDLKGLKQGIESWRTEAEKRQQELERKDSEIERFKASSEAALKALVERDKAIAERDQKIRDLDESLAATRKRLDEAIEVLKKQTPR